MRVNLGTMYQLQEPYGKPDSTDLRDAVAHLEADWRNAVWVDGVHVKAMGWHEDHYDDRLVVNGVVSKHRDLRRLVKSRDWPETP